MQQQALPACSWCDGWHPRVTCAQAVSCYHHRCTSLNLTGMPPSRLVTHVQAGDGVQRPTMSSRFDALSHSMKDAVGKAVSPLMSALQPQGLTEATKAPAGADTEVKVEAVDAVRPSSKLGCRVEGSPCGRTFQ